MALQAEQAQQANNRKTKAPTNKERFESLENQLAGDTAALERLTAGHRLAPQLTPQPVSPIQAPLDQSTRSPPPLSRASTPKNNGMVRRALVNNFTDLPCNTSLLADPLLNNIDILNDENTRRHVDRMSRAAAARLPRSAGKPVYDTYLNKMVAYEMPRHFVGIHSQRRIRSLESHDDLLLAEFLQGFVKMIIHSGITNSRTEAMVKYLGRLGEALIDYAWEDIRDCINAVLHEVGQGRMSRLDEKVY